MRAERAREKAAHAVDDAIRAGKLVPALREWWSNTGPRT